MLQKTHKAARKALKQGIIISFKFNNTKSDTMVIIARDSKTGKLLNNWGREGKHQTDKQFAKAIKTMVRDIKNRNSHITDFDVIDAIILPAIVCYAINRDFKDWLKNRKSKLNKV